MVNLFKYAKKELSQDAFIMWVVANYEAKDKALKNVSHKFIKFLVGNKIKTEGIEEIRFRPQWNKIDIVLDFIMKDGKVFSVYIEDKTTSKEHNQLIKYSEQIEKYTERSVEEPIKLFYKTDYIDDEEQKRVEDAGWNIIGLKRINDFWQEFINHKNPIITMYAKRVNEIYLALKNKALPKQNEDEEIERFYWKGFFLNSLKPYVEKRYGGKYEVEITQTVYNYVAFIVREAGYKKPIPYIELRSRDCQGAHFEAKMLTYGMSGKKQKCREYDRIQKFNKGIPETLFTTKNAGTKQVLRTETIDVKNKDEFVHKIVDCLDIYSKIMGGIFKK